MTAHRFTSRRALPGLGIVATTAVLGSLSSSVPAMAGNHKDCPRPDKQQAPEDMIRAHVALLAAGNVDAALCDYDDDATVILPGTLVSGKDAIGGALSGFASLLGGAAPQISTLTASGSVVLLTFQVQGVPCVIPDGADTYVVEKGRIVTQTVHDTLQSAPGSTCPAAP